MGAQTTQANFAAITRALEEMQETLSQILVKVSTPNAVSGAQAGPGRRPDGGKG